MPTPAVKTYIPQQVSDDCLKDNRKLLSDEDIANAKKLLAADEHVSSKTSELPYTLIKIDGQYYAVYRKPTEPGYEPEDKRSRIAVGAEGSFKLMQDLETGEWVALKVRSNFTSPGFQDTDPNFKENQSNIETEINNLKALEMDRGSAKRDIKNSDTPGSKYNGKTGSKYYVAMNLAKGDNLHDFLKGNHVLSPEQCLKITWNLLAAYKKHFTDKGWAHRDIKPQNIMIDPDTCEITFIDVGFARKLGTQENQTNTPRGTQGYIPPEVINHHKEKLPIVVETSWDIYSLGKTLQVVFGLKKDKLKAGSGINKVLEDDEATVWNSRTHETQRKEIKHVLDLMVAASPDKRASLDSAMKQFKLPSIIACLNRNLLKNTTNPDVREFYLGSYQKLIQSWAKIIFNWLEKQSNPIVLREFYLNLDHVLAEVIQLNLICDNFNSHIEANLNRYKANIIKINQLDDACKNYQNHLDKSKDNVMCQQFSGQIFYK